MKTRYRITLALIVDTIIIILFTIYTGPLFVSIADNPTSGTTLAAVVGLGVVGVRINRIAKRAAERNNKPYNSWYDIFTGLCSVAGFTGIILTIIDDPNWKIVGFTLYGIAPAVLSAIIGVVVSNEYERNSDLGIKWAIVLVIGSGVLILVGGVIGVCGLWNEDWCMSSEQIFMMYGLITISACSPLLGAGMQIVFKKYTH